MGFMSESRKVSLWARDRLYIDAELRADGSLAILGQDLNPGNPFGGEYEYALTVRAADVPRVVAALGGGPDDDVLALLSGQGEQIVRTGEKRWLREIGVEADFWSRVGG